jgi:hypothetical protein
VVVVSGRVECRSRLRAGEREEGMKKLEGGEACSRIVIRCLSPWSEDERM